MKICGCLKVRKHKEIKGSDKYFTLEISSKFDSLEKMKTTSSESKVKLERSVKGLVTAPYFATKVRLQNYKMARYAIVNVSEKDLSKIIKEFEKIGKLPYEDKRPKHEPTHSYFRLVRQLANSMMISDNSIGTITAVIQKLMLCHQTLMLRTRTNQNKSSCTKLYRKIILRT